MENKIKFIIAIILFAIICVSFVILMIFDTVYMLGNNKNH